MKITSITSYGPNTAFGYNRQYHEKVHEFLKSKDKDPCAHYALEFDKLTLQMEDDAIELEKQGKTHTRKYSNIFNDLIFYKDIVTCIMQTRYPKLEYADNLAKQYIAESLTHHNKDAADWRAYMVNVVKKYSYSDFSRYFGMPSSDTNDHEPIFKEVSESEAKDLMSAMGDETAHNTDNTDVKQMLVKFEPTKSSPRGLDDVVGLDSIKDEFKENIIDYINNPEHLEQDYDEYGIRMPRGYLFYGPPGCGKTFVTQALAMEAGVDMYKMDISKFGSHYYNKTAVDIQRAFDYLVDEVKKSGKPAILFMDEVDSLAIKRDGNMQTLSDDAKVTTTLLKITQEARDNNIIVISATNKIDMLDEAFVSRMGKQIYFPPPDVEQIEKLLVKMLSSRKKGEVLAKSSEQIKKLANMLKTYSARSIEMIVDDASKTARRDNRRDIEFGDIERAIKNSNFDTIDEKYYRKEAKKPKVGF